MGVENKFRKALYMGCGAETKHLKVCIRRYEEFKYLGVKIDKEHRQEDGIKNRINKGRAVRAILNSVLWN